MRHKIFGLDYLEYGGGGGGAVGGAGAAKVGGAVGAAAGGATTAKDTPNVIEGTEKGKFWVAKVQDNVTGKKLYSIEDGVAATAKADGAGAVPAQPQTQKTGGTAAAGPSKIGGKGG